MANQDANERDRPSAIVHRPFAIVHRPFAVCDDLGSGRNGGTEPSWAAIRSRRLSHASVYRIRSSAALGRSLGPPRAAVNAAMLGIEGWVCATRGPSCQTDTSPRRRFSLAEMMVI